MGIISGIVKTSLAIVTVAVAGPLVIPVLLSGDMSGIDGYCDDE